MAGPPRFVPPCAVPAGMPVPSSMAEHQLIERTAAFAAANGEGVLGALALKQGARLPFLHAAHPLHAYFRQLVLLQRPAPPPPHIPQGGAQGGAQQGGAQGGGQGGAQQGGGWPAQ